MAIQAERHAQRLRVIHLIHLVDLPVALHATDAPVHVHRVVEIDVIRHPVNLHPRDRPARLRALPHQRQPRIVLQHLAVAVHARRRRRDVRIPRLLHPVMAVAAIHPQLVHVHRVRERHRLQRLIPHPRILRRQVIPHPGRDRRRSQRPAHQDQPRQPIRPLWEYGRHCVMLNTLSLTPCFSRAQNQPRTRPSLINTPLQRGVTPTTSRLFNRFNGFPSPGRLPDPAAAYWGKSLTSDCLLRKRRPQDF